MAQVKVLKKENRLLDIKQDSTITFDELNSWYLKLENVKKLKSYWLAELRIGNFTNEFGGRVVSSVKKSEIENFQTKLLKNMAPATVDHVIEKTRTMVNKAVDDDLLSGDILKIL